MKFGILASSNMQNSMVMFTFSFLDRKYHFLINLVHKFEIVSLSWNSVPRLCCICKIRWWYSILPFKTIQKIHLAFWCYLINLPAVYSQTLKPVAFLVLIKRTWNFSLIKGDFRNVRKIWLKYETQVWPTRLSARENVL